MADNPINEKTRLEMEEGRRMIELRSGVTRDKREAAEQQAPAPTAPMPKSVVPKPTVQATPKAKVEDYLAGLGIDSPKKG